MTASACVFPCNGERIGRTDRVKPAAARVLHRPCSTRKRRLRGRR